MLHSIALLSLLHSSLVFGILSRLRVFRVLLILSRPRLGVGPRPLSALALLGLILSVLLVLLLLLLLLVGLFAAAFLGFVVVRACFAVVLPPTLRLLLIVPLAPLRVPLSVFLLLSVISSMLLFLLLLSLFLRFLLFVVLRVYTE